MAWALDIADLGGSASKTANQASTTYLMNVLAAGKVAIGVIAVDNNQTTDGDEGAVTGVTDARGNTWTKAAEFTNGQGGAQSGATCSIWYSKLTTAFQAGDLVTVSFSNSASRDASAGAFSGFTIGAGNTVSVEATNTLANDNADPGSLNATTANAEFLRFRGIAGETNSTTVLTATSGWTLQGAAQTTGGGAASNMAVRGEFHISTGTGDASDPTWVAMDNASVYVAFKEVPPGKAKPVYRQPMRFYNRRF